VRTPRGTIEIEFSDPNANVSVAVDGNNVDIGGLDDPLSLEVGEHELKVRGKGYETYTKKLTITRGKNAPLTVTLQKRKPPEPAPSPTLPPTFENSLGMEFVLVPKGKSWLGGGGGKIGDEEVEIAKDFYLGKYAVTQEEWEKVMQKNPSHFSRTGAGKDAVKDVPDDQLRRFPVEMVSWEDCKEFVTRLNEKTHESGWTYRLPTEVEWEYACRGGPMADRFESMYDFYFDKPKKQLLPDQANFGNGDNGRTCQVGSYKPNRLGLHDMHGNVHQWCDDEARVARGGSKYSPPEYCRAATRFVENKPLHRTNGSGLRLACVAVSKNPKEATSAPPAGATPPPLATAPFDAMQAAAHQEAWAKHLGTKVEIENSLGMKLRLLPPGEFKMGSPPSEADRRGDEIQHRVRITKPFYLGVYEVTQREYQNVMGNNPSHYSPGAAGKDQVRGLDTDQFPVENVSWDDAVEFCRKLSALAAEQTAGRVYRLPTEAEWEYACRAGTTTPFHVGDKLNGQQANYDGQHPFATNGGGPFLGRPTEVGSYAPNPFGLRDMHGNVAEWCWNWHEFLIHVVRPRPTSSS